MEQQQQTETLLQTISNDESSLSVLYFVTVAEGIHLLFSGQAEKAELLFDSLKRLSGLHALGYGMTAFMRSIMTCDPTDIEEAISGLRYAEKHAARCSPLTKKTLDAMQEEVVSIVLAAARKVRSTFGTISGSNIALKAGDTDEVSIYEEVTNDGRVGGPVHPSYQRHHRRTSSTSSVTSSFATNLSFDTNAEVTSTNKPGFFARIWRGHRRRLSSSSNIALNLADVTALERDLIIADALAMIGFLHFAQENILSYIKGAICLRKAFKLFENAREISTSQGFHNASLDKRGAIARRREEIKSSAHYGYGFLNVIFSALPPRVLRVVENFGVKGDRELGLKECLSTIDLGGTRTPFAELSVLVYYYILSPILGVSPAQAVENDPAKAEARVMLDICMAKYSNGPMFLWIYGRARRDEGALADATYSIGTAAQISHKAGMYQMEQLCYYDMGWCCLMDFRFMEAIDAFKNAASSSSNWSPGFYSYLIGCCYLVTDGEDSYQYALKSFEEVPKKVKKTWMGKISLVDKLALRKSKTLVGNRDSQFSLGILYMVELLYLWNCIYSTIPKLPKLLEELEKLEDNQHIHESGDRRALYCLLKGIIYRDLGHMEKAIDCFMLVEGQKNKVYEDKYVLPHAAFELGLLYMRQGNGEEAREALLRSRDGYSGYEFEDRLHFRLHTLLMKVDSSIEKLPKYRKSLP
jgi:tetratricopeptide (TPR) repeat protein